jgi:replicative DNA helicase
VFFVVNGGGNSDLEVIAKGKARAQFMEIDERKDENGKPLLDENGNKIKIPFPEQLEIIKNFPLEPSIIVRTSKSLHTYWLLDNGDIKQFREIQQRLAAYFHSDAADVNESRTMRLPGFNHCKADPVPVVIIKFDPGIRYTQQELATLLPQVPKRYSSQLLPVDSNEPTLYEKAGGRHNALIQYGGKLRRSGLNADEITAQMLSYNSTLPEPLPERELNRTIADILKYKSRDEFEELQEDAKAQDMAEQVIDPADIVNKFIQTIQTEAYKPYSTDLSFFDNLLGGGVIRQSIVQLIAAPSAGKTTLCQQIAEAMARHGKEVLYLNLEMSAEQMLAKAISCRLGKNDNSEIISATDIMQGYKWDTKQRERILKELERYKKDTAPFIRYTNANANLDNIISLLNAMGEKATKEGKAGPVVFVDYLHLINGPKYGDAKEILKAAVGCFKEYAVKYNSIVFLIVAANRDSNKTGQLTLYSGRDSSAIEYSGDYILSLDYTEIDNGNIKPTDEAELSKLKSGSWRDMTLRVLKHRLGVPGVSAKLWYRPAANIFYDSTDFMPIDPERERIAEEARERALAKNPEPIERKVGSKRA